jgi:hypothetical protein
MQRLGYAVPMLADRGGSDYLHNIVHWCMPGLNLTSATPDQEWAIVRRIEDVFAPRNFLDWLKLPRMVGDIVARDWMDILLETTPHEDALGYSSVYVH